MMANPIQARTSAKRCFVTIGATAPFNSLIKEVLGIDFIRELQRAGYTELRIQYGDHEGEAIFKARKDELKTFLEADINVDITGFGFDRTGLNNEIAAVKGHSAETEGMVISHAGESSSLILGEPAVTNALQGRAPYSMSSEWAFLSWSCRTQISCTITRSSWLKPWHSRTMSSMES
jgi:beta-1,4-N-acetylglucosaminyltransferase